MTDTPARLTRRTQAERSQQTREKLLRATVDVLMERGYAGLTTAEVNARAGVSSGARVHHYRTKADLVIAATDYIYELGIEDGRRRAESIRTAADPLSAFIADSRAIYFDKPFIVACEVLIAARTDPDLMARMKPIMERYRATMNEIWLSSFQAAGLDEAWADDVLNLTLNMIRGMAINRLWQGDPSRYDRLLGHWQAIVAALPRRGAAHLGALPKARAG